MRRCRRHVHLTGQSAVGQALNLQRKVRAGTYEDSVAFSGPTFTEGN